MKFFEYYSYPNKGCIEEFNPVEFLTKREPLIEATGIWIRDPIKQDPGSTSVFAINYGDARHINGQPAYVAFQIEGRTYDVSVDDKSISVCSEARNPYYDTCKIAERVVMEGRPIELLADFLTSGYQLRE